MGIIRPEPVIERIELAEEPEFDIGGVTVKPAERAVLMAGERRELQPRVMQVFVALARARPAVVSRDRLVEQCWDGRVVGDDALNRVILSLRNLAKEFTPPPFAIETVPRVGHRLVEGPGAKILDGPGKVASRRARLPIVAMVLVIVGAAVALAVLRASQGGERPLAVLVSAAAGDGISRALAADLVIKLGSLETARATSLRLISAAQETSANPDLILEVGGAAEPAAIEASVVLKAAPDREILWSKQFEQPSRNLADLKQQVAYTAARVLGCAAETSNATEERLKQQTVKLYLNGCAALANLYGREAESVVPMFREVLRQAPGFELAWGKLLLAETDVFLHTQSIAARNRLKSDLAAARSTNPELPEAYLAQIELMPFTAHADRMRLVNSAIQVSPDHADAYVARARQLQFVGRMKDAVVDARRAMELDPFSPRTRDGYIYALANAGRLDTAFEEVQKMERLWPGASIVAGVRYFLNLRYGDPRQALAYLRANPSDDWMNGQSYLEARANPTAANVERAIRDAERLYRTSPRTLQHLVQVYGEFDREEDLLKLFLRAPAQDVEFVELTFRPPGVDFWRDRRSLLVAKRAGLLNYWRTTGQWPDFCYQADLPYDCKAEAAKI